MAQKCLHLTRIGIQHQPRMVFKTDLNYKPTPVTVAKSVLRTFCITTLFHFMSTVAYSGHNASD